MTNNKKIYMSLDLNKLANKLDEALSNETSKTLTKFLNDKRMTNNKQQTAVEWLWEIAYNRELTIEDWKQAKEKYEHEMCEFAVEYAQYELQQNKPGIKGAMVSMCAWTFFKNRRK